MANHAELLSREVKIKYRTSTNLILRKGTLFYNEDMQTVEVESSGSDESNTKVIKLSCLSTVKAMDYIEGTRVNCVLILRHKLDTAEESSLANDVPQPEEEEIIIQFTRVEDRDNWDTGLRYMMNALEVTVAKDQVEGPTKSFSRIKKVRLEEPRAGVLEAILEIPEHKADAKNLNNEIVKWVQDNCVQPSETTSLYRLVKSLVHRTTLESKTADVIQRINDCNFDKMLKAQGASVEDQGMAVLELTKAHLREIENDIPTFIGQQGTAATMITQILRRNVEKMKVINDLAYKIYASSHRQTAA
eukprot:symbB.v1.2.003387.t1/scaffold190.1/size276550/12